MMDVIVALLSVALIAIALGGGLVIGMLARIEKKLDAVLQKQATNNKIGTPREG